MAYRAENREIRKDMYAEKIEYKEKRWDNLTSFFEYLNKNTEYVVMRNFDGLPLDYLVVHHGDIDLLVSDYEAVCNMTGAKKVYSESYRVHQEVYIGNKKVRFDFRFVGDGYYDKQWQRGILERRVIRNGIYIPSEEDFKYMLLYHALVQKREVAPDYVRKLDDLFGEGRWGIDVLKVFLKNKRYKLTCPRDISVIYNWQLAGGGIPIKRYVQQLVYFLKAYVCNRRIRGGIT